MVVALVATVATTAFAQSRKKGKGRVIKIDAVTVEGKIQKPEAFYILQHASLNYERLDAKKTFIPELLDSVKEKPF